MNNEESIEAVLRAFIAENLLFSGNKFPYSDQDSFLEQGIIDSMNIMEIVLFVEEKFKVKIDDSEILPENFDSIDQLTKFIRQKKS